ncbi:MAG: HAD family phosphatase [Oscillospiraceae bacterium]|nr:HAD family phosphatase [Oscillospiraceae bacterium]
MNRRFAIFDFDGTLVDSMPYWQMEERNFLTERGVTDPHVLDATMERIKPLGILEASEILVDRFRFPDNPKDVAARFVAAMSVRYRESIPAKDGVKEYLKALKATGARIAVASGTGADLMEVCLQRLGLLDIFEFTLSCLDVGAGKDRPDVYLEAARRLGAEPSEIAVYEDSDIAMRTAKGAGFYGVGVYDPQGADHWDELKALADEYLDDWRTARP